RALKPGAPDPPPLLRPSRGIHLLYPPLTRGHALLLFARSDGRVFFVIPFADHALVGTTEIEVHSPPAPGADQPTVEEVRYLRAELRRALPGPSNRAMITMSSGLRP